MKTDPELEAALDRAGQEIQRLGTVARTHWERAEHLEALLRVSEGRLQACREALALPARAPEPAQADVYPHHLSAADLDLRDRCLRANTPPALRWVSAERRAKLAEAELQKLVHDLQPLQPAQNADEWGKRLSEVAMLRLATATARAEKAEAALWSARDSAGKFQSRARGLEDRVEALKDRAGKAEAEVRDLQHYHTNIDKEYRRRLAAQQALGVSQARIQVLEAQAVHYETRIAELQRQVNEAAQVERAALRDSVRVERPRPGKSVVMFNGQEMDAYNDDSLALYEAKRLRHALEVRP